MRAKSLELPDYMYFFPKVSATSISPTAAFDPTMTGDRPWAASSPPSKQKIPKTLLFCGNAFEGYSWGESVAILELLSQGAGFKIYFLSKNDDALKIHQVHNDRRDFKIPSAPEFDTRDDYK